MNLGERVACIETKLKTIEKLLYFIMLGVSGTAGAQLLPFLA